MTTIVGVSEDVDKIRAAFFRALFGDLRGYLCIARKAGEAFSEEFFEYPDDIESALAFINANFSNYNLYFCPQLLDKPRRVKGNVVSVACLWADLDSCEPNELSPAPNIALASSPGRYQGFWLLDTPALGFDAEDASHRIAYAYRDKGVDSSGWDLTQLLRIPLTYNMKYQLGDGMNPVVEILSADVKNRVSINEFANLEAPPGTIVTADPVPELDSTADEIIQQYSTSIGPETLRLIQDTPENDWSGTLWRLECLLLEAGLTKAETFIVAREAACNKYARDGRGDEYLWRDVSRAASRVWDTGERKELRLSELLNPQEAAAVKMLPKSFVDRYLDWAKTTGDAAYDYHEVSAFMILSGLLAGSVHLLTSFGEIIPNLWVMLLADTTLTRKSTAMEMAMDLLLAVESDAILATDGSIEGLMSTLSTRPKKPSIFWRDEFSGLLESIRKKDYLAGMMEALTKLYDGKYQKRLLRKEVIEIRDPVLLFFCGGIHGKIIGLVDDDMVASGFIPRFIFIVAESKIENYRPLGPMTQMHDSIRAALVKELSEIKETYNTEVSIKLGEQLFPSKKVWDVTLTPEAWDRYNAFEQQMVQDGVESDMPEFLTPAFDRLAKSGLKMAILLAASRSRPTVEQEVVVEVTDMLSAISYIERWRHHTLHVVSNAGKGFTERRLENIYQGIIRNPGITRSRLMQNHHLTKREADTIFDTLEERGQVRKQRHGRTFKLYPTQI